MPATVRVSAFVQNISRSYERILTKFFDGVGHGPQNNRLDFGGDPDLLPLFCPNFSLRNAFLNYCYVAIVYYYSSRGSTCLDGCMRSLVKYYL